MQPSGEVHLGNYIGAIRNWVELQDDHELILSVVDLHAITVPQKPDELRRRSIELAKILIACGIDTKKTILFKQSEVVGHTELAWILSTITGVGELNRMTQFKDKTQREGADSASAGLFNYPVLQAADVLLYDSAGEAIKVPVGEDQKQHLELMRDLAHRFNTRFGDTFKQPEPLIHSVGARIMGLDDPKVKMSKSAGPSNYIALLDDADAIKKKVSRAVTDSEEGITSDRKRAGLYNLLTIEAALNGTTVKHEAEEQDFEGFAEYKSHVADVIIKSLEPIKARYNQLSDEEVIRVLEQGAEKANQIASKKLREVQQKVGLL
jgi:tryptophanyl-tRNA synthetase